MDAETGVERWRAGAGLHDPVFPGTLLRLFLAAGRKGLYAFQAESGEQVWHHQEVSGSNSWSTHTAGDHLYVVWSGAVFR
ncbi:hypothetical protein [Streptomyces sp. NPDC058739]|uniref:hypothetical protein n=1 Tax=Streptomyces sp. NPDC058739 TaxID=3346618 RepID=UPI0036C1E73E